MCSSKELIIYVRLICKQLRVLIHNKVLPPIFKGYKISLGDVFYVMYLYGNETEPIELN